MKWPVEPIKLQLVSFIFFILTTHDLTLSPDAFGGREESAIKIQKVFRGHQVRKKLKSTISDEDLVRAIPELSDEATKGPGRTSSLSCDGSAGSLESSISLPTLHSIRTWLEETTACMVSHMKTYLEATHNQQNDGIQKDVEMSIFLAMKLQIEGWLQGEGTIPWARLGGAMLGDAHRPLEPAVMAPCSGGERDAELRHRLVEGMSKTERADLQKGLQGMDLITHFPTTAFSYELRKFFTDSVSKGLPSLRPKDGVWPPFVQQDETHSEEMLRVLDQNSERSYILHRYSDAGLLTELNSTPGTGKRVEIGAQTQLMLTQGDIIYVDIGEGALESTRKAAEALQIRAEYKLEDMNESSISTQSVEVIVSKNVPFFLNSSLRLLKSGGRRFFLHQGSRVLPVSELYPHYRPQIVEAESHGLTPEFVLTDHWSGLMVRKP